MSLVTLSSGSSFELQQGVSILDAATHAKISLPYSCKTGRCSTCKCKVITGQSRALYDETGITEQEKAEGWILSCARTAETDLLIEVDDLGGVTLPPVKTYPCRIVSIEKLASDVVRVYLRLPPTADFSFIPGQYVELIGPAGIRRSYSIANSSFEDKQIELHIRAVDGGVMSDYWFNQAKVNDLLRLNGPLGTFFLRDTAGVDLILLATGTGIAPVKSIVVALNHLVNQSRPRSVTVLWGGRTPHDLYFDFGALVQPDQFIPVLSRAGQAWVGSRGYVQDVLLSKWTDFSNAAVYACGSNAMISSAKSTLVNAGLSPRRFFSDAFVCSAEHSSN